MKKKLFIVGAVVVMIVFFAYMLIDINYNSAPEGYVGGDTSLHGCKASAGYSWCPLRAQCVRSFELENYEMQCFAWFVD